MRPAGPGAEIGGVLAISRLVLSSMGTTSGGAISDPGGAGSLVVTASITGYSGPCATGFPETVQFDGTAAGGAPPYNDSWDFGDGSAPSYAKDPECLRKLLGFVRPAVGARRGGRHPERDG